ncbi:hypothetical protein UFOVP66_35 [uncultured Caudovirales phage]|uniref:Uncharacterized protein n=1 Tax=uncultured Caudovirales phage TaxID=2100421 RepID=A0A6J5KX85_9CAUD|nr:hypothetical protein UFOVP66_35 [uncultured Caudovirales phage]
MPILMLLSNRYVQLALVVVVGLAALWGYGKHQRNLGYSDAQTEYTQRALIATQAARKRELNLQNQLQEAQNESQRNQIALTAAANSARNELDGLRGELATINDRLSRATADAVRLYARTANAVLAECTDRYSKLAQKADQHANDSLMLSRAWPKP